jgi:putative transposase
MNERPETTRFYWGRLPHWEVVRGRYFVTIRLQGAIPQQGLERIARLRDEAERAVINGQDGFRERRVVFRQMEGWLHRSKAVAHMRDPVVADMVVEALESRAMDGTWTLFSYVVMPNHIHAFLRLGRDQADSTDAKPGPATDGALTLVGVLHDFKVWTARQANRLLGRTGQFWQREWFDHWSRSLEQDAGIERYIRANPVQAGLVTEAREWRWLK